MKTPYLNQIEFKNLLNTEVDEQQFQQLLVLAEQKINRISHNRIVAVGFKNLTEFQKEKIKLAIAYQIDYLLKNGLEDDTEALSYSVLDISVNVDKSNQSYADKIHMSNIAYNFMQETGLCTGNFRWH